MPEPSGPADHPFRGRAPTSHERLAGRPWDASYQEGTPPWEIGRPQPAMVRLAARVRFAGPVLDAGCGTGEHALYVASLGLAVWGVDVAETALEVARKKAHDRGLQCTFALVDALHLERLGREFKTVLDCGLFHTFDGEERLRYAASLASVTAPEGTLHVLCFSDEGPDPGPHPISQEDLRTAFCPGKGWHVAEVEPERIKTRDPGNRGAPAWIATIQRVSTEDAAERVGG